MKNGCMEWLLTIVHPKMALWYRKAIKGFRKSLKDGKTSEAKENVRAFP